MTNLLPNESISETNQTLTVNNPSLLPQMAKNWDVSLQYYFEPVGNLSVGWFQKRIRDYIVSGIVSGTIGGGADNGYNGEYQGFTRLMSANAGTAKVDGWEISYQQQFTFLPGVLKGLGGFANYTRLETSGDFGGRTNLSTGQIAGCDPLAVPQNHGPLENVVQLAHIPFPRKRHEDSHGRAVHPLVAFLHLLVVALDQMLD